MTLDAISGDWHGTCELWEDPLGDNVQTSECSMHVEGNTLSYQWAYQDKPHHGELKFSPEGTTYSDTWHQDKPVACELVPSTALATVQYTYMKEWGWRIDLCQRPHNGDVVVLMTNIAPWGERARAVRMTYKRVEEEASKPGR